jgi:SAM-dependent methyltransferase
VGSDVRTRRSRFWFGLYHWQTRLRRLALALVVALVSTRLFREQDERVWAVGLLGGLWAVVRGYGVLDSLFRPPPWAVETYKYEALGERLPTTDADDLLDVGCGTGRSLVGLASAIPADCTVLGLDVFDDEIILGNGPHLATRNAARAGLDVDALCGDATRLPVADRSQDVVTACRVLHDLSAEGAASALTEAHRVCRPDGRIGVLELPITHAEGGADPATYWRERVADAGFAIETVSRVPRRSEGADYVLVIGTPATPTPQ